MAREPEQVHVERLLGALDDTDVVRWACEALSGSFQDDDLVREIASLNAADRYELERAAQLLSQLVDCRGFIVNSPRGIALARDVLRRKCRLYLAAEISPYELCRLVCPIEQAFDFPQWLGNLYNACDWVDPKTKRAEVPHLEAEVAAVLASLNDDPV